VQTKKILIYKTIISHLLYALISDESLAVKRGWNKGFAGYGKRGWNNGFAAGYGKRALENEVDEDELPMYFYDDDMNTDDVGDDDYNGDDLWVAEKRAWNSGFSGSLGKRAWNSGFAPGMGKRAWNSGFAPGMGKRAWNSGFAPGMGKRAWNSGLAGQ